MVNKKKNTNIPPIIENGTFITGFKEKANVFNSYFAEQCKPFNMRSSLPNLKLRSKNRLTNINILERDIISIINKLNPKKAHGCDGISIQMIKMCPSEIAKPLSLIFKRCIEDGYFPKIWKKANVQPVHKKASRQTKTNYRPISLLPVCGKILEKVIFDNMYAFFTRNKLITKNQSGFRPGDSTINQLLAITTEIYEAFENSNEVRAAFLDISKAFDKVWHEGLIFKLKQNGINGSLLTFLENYLSDRYQRVVLNGMESNWEKVYSGVPQGSVLGPLLFLIYINDLDEGISSNIKLFADDSSLFARVIEVGATHQQIMKDLDTITKWASQWKMVFNPDITKQAIEVIFSQKYKKPIHPPLTFNGIPVAREESTKHLGVTLDHHLTFRKHITNAIEKANKGIGLMLYLSKYVNRKVLEQTYKMYVRPHLDYGDVIFHGQLSDMMKALESVQYQAALIVTGCWQGTSMVKLYKELGWETLEDRRIFRRFSLFYKIKQDKSPIYLNSLIREVPEKRTKRYEKSFFPFCILNWEDLSENIRNSANLDIFKKNYMYEKAKNCKKRDFYDVSDRYGLSLLTRLRTEFSDLRDHRFRHKFNCLNPICKCGLENETVEHFFLRCPRFSTPRNDLLLGIQNILKHDINSTLISPTHRPSDLTNLLLYGSESFNGIANKLILETSIRFVLFSKRFKVIEAYENT